MRIFGFGKPKKTAFKPLHLKQDHETIKFKRGHSLKFGNKNGKNITFEVFRLNDGRYFVKQADGRVAELKENIPLAIVDKKNNIAWVLKASGDQLVAQDSTKSGIYIHPFSPIERNIVSQITPQSFDISFASLSKREPDWAQLNNIMYHEEQNFAPGFNRPLALDGTPGAYLKYTGDKTVILIGDLHENNVNLAKILEKYGEGLKNGTHLLVFLGDALHAEKAGRVEELFRVDRAIAAINTITALKTEFPHSVYYLEGNHCQLLGEEAPLVAKGFEFDKGQEGKIDQLIAKYPGLMVKVIDEKTEQWEGMVAVRQAALLAALLREARGDEYVVNVDRFFKASPVIFRVPNLVAFHAGGYQARKGIVPSVNEFVNGRVNPEVSRKLRWSKPVQSSDGNKYEEGDLAILKQGLSISPNGLIVGGHVHAEGNWFIPDGEVDTISPAGLAFNYSAYSAVKGQVVLMSSYDHALSVLEVQGTKAKVIDLNGRSPIGGAEYDLASPSYSQLAQQNLLRPQA